MITTAAAVVSATMVLSTGWITLGLPRPAMHAELQVVQMEQSELKSIILNDIRLRLKRELNGIEQQIWLQRQEGKAPPDWMVREKADLEQRLDEIDRELRNLVEQDG